MTKIQLLPQTEKVSGSNPYRLDPWPLYHQMRTVEALRGHDLVMNTYNTGTGKTIASLLHLFTLQEENQQVGAVRKNALFIAPTNALLAQHADDIETFVAENGLDFAVKRVTAAEIRNMEREQRLDQARLRPGETLQRLIQNYLEFEPDEVMRKPLILVVNPDIFYYALYFRYGAHDQRNLFERFVESFDYIVVDEFHYYDYKQLANFLFAFTLFDQLGYFAVRGRKVCLLSATPAAAVISYLDRIFGSRWTRVGPDNEPPESAACQTTPALSPMTLEIISEESLRDWAVDHGQSLVDWILRDQLDGAIISSSLAQINSVYATLRPLLADSRMGRITGPEPEAARLESTARDLILATPTVDIGYNFVKQGKARQNVDFIVCDARFGDELLQRIGRAGRVLGKEETTAPSRAIALLPAEAIAALNQYDGQMLSRPAFAQLIRDCAELPPKHTLTSYIRSHAITECFWPIYSLGKMLPPHLNDELQALYDRMLSVFAPNSRRSMGGLQGFFRTYEKRERWLSAARKGVLPYDKMTAENVADWLAFLDPENNNVRNEKIDAAHLQPHLTRLLSGETQRRDLIQFVHSQVTVTRSLFSFRDSFQGPTAVIYDAEGRFSSRTVNQYDLFHLVRNYHLSSPLTRNQFQEQYERTELVGDFYFELRTQREIPLVLEFVYESDYEAESFEQKWCSCPVGLSGMRLQVRDRGGDPIVGGLDHAIVTALVEQTLLILIVPPKSVGPMIHKLRGTNLWAQKMTVRFPDGSQDDGYRVLTGASAFHAHAELLGHFRLKDRLREEALIL
ncbi:MAG: type I-D CRISPR-associated helicase Cas3' [Caldilineaceae bacterium]|nr:type I-D CRISPR-associated helicase Cas3' [Caldilineaceae bacterium]